MRNPVRKALACFAAIALVVTAAGSASAMTKEDASCRATIAKNGGKVGSTTAKAIAGCIKNNLKTPATTNCTNPAAYDTSAKVSGAKTKAVTAIPGKCVSGVVSASLLPEFQPACPSPGNDLAVTSINDVAQCTVDISQQMLENLYNYVLKPDYVAIAADKETSKCANTIAKNVNKVWGTIQKGRASCQNTIDKGLMGSYDYVCTKQDVVDPTGKIGPAVTAAAAAIDAACNNAAGLSDADRGKLNSCTQAQVGLGACIMASVEKNAGGVTATEYEYAGVCPKEVRVEANAGTGGGTIGAGNGSRLTHSKLDTGWTGLGHFAEIVEGFVGRVNLTCSDTSCGSCTVTTNCEAGNCRCSNNHTIQCGAGTGPFTQDSCGAGNLCKPDFGPPLALSAGGSPVCVVNTINTELVGTADIGDGSSTTTVDNIAKVFLGVGQNKPCPTCSGALNAAGTCSGGANNGAACVTNALHPDFGGTSYQCQPALASNISGAGLKVNLTLTDAPVSLAFGDSCDPPNGALTCVCGVCSGDNTVTCNADATCSALAAGPAPECTGAGAPFACCTGAGTGKCCTKGGTGANRRPNNCNDNTCEDQGGELGECNGENDLFCDGFLRQTGDGILTCSTNGDCSALDSECPGGGAGACGECSLAQTKRCFLNPIDASGVPGQDGAELVSNFCSPPTNNVGINNAGGIPGAGRAVIDWDFKGFCPTPNDTREFELGGSNCQ
jgi:hypothetical protein